MTYLVGLSGGIGSGKSTVAGLFAERGIEVIDTDHIAREVVAPNSPALKKITDYFGPEIIQPNQHLNRSKLRDIIFNDDEKRVWLENLLHPLIGETTLLKTTSVKSPYCLILIPLLTNSPLRRALNYLITVESDETLQIKRASLRDQCTPEHIQKIIQSQPAKIYRLQEADSIIDNNQDIHHLIQQVEKLHQQLLILSR
ncbi:MAG: dephospho-CoA kinase [Legionellales bacterium]|nr:dephospho-CoA kinase [Legionellales bacterium]